MQVKAVCRLSQYGAGVNCALGVLPLLPQSATRRLLPSSPMGRQQHQCMRIPIIAYVDTTPLPWCHLGTLPLDSLSLDEHVNRQALKFIFAGCKISDQFQFVGYQISAPFHFEAHLLFGSESTPQYEFFDLIGH